MSRDLEDLLPKLEPPRGGLEKLRGRIAADRPSPRGWLVPLGAATALCSALIFGFATGHLPIVDREEQRAPSFDHFDNPAWVRFGLSEPPSEPVTIISGKTSVAA